MPQDIFAMNGGKLVLGAAFLSNAPIQRDGGPDQRVREVDIGESGMRAIEQTMRGRIPLNREYRRAPGRLDLSDYRAE